MTEQTSSKDPNVEWYLRWGEPISPNSVRKIDWNKQTANYTYVPQCGRCGGLGGSDVWRHTGYTCYQCGGSGQGNAKTVKVYTQEKLEKLDAALLKRRAKAEEKKRAKEKARIEAARGPWEAWCSEHADLVQGIREFAEKSSFLTSLMEQIDNIRILTDVQVEAAENKLTRLRKARAEKEKAKNSQWVGDIDERREFIITVLHTVDVSGFASWSHHIVFRMLYICNDDAGNRIIYIGNSEKFPQNGERATIKATVKSHDKRDGVKQTVVRRPVVVCRLDS